MSESLLDQLDEKKSGPIFDRNFWRNSHSGAPIVPLPNGKKATMGAPSSRWKSNGEDTYNLQQWSERQVLIGAIKLATEELPVLPDDPDSNDGKKIINDLVLAAKTRAGADLAAERGTHGHFLSELHDEGASWLDELAGGNNLGLSDPLQAAIVEAWQRLITEHDLEILGVEVTVVSEITGTAGTLDRIARTRRAMTFQTARDESVTIPAGTVVILDVKTGKLRIGTRKQPSYWSGYALQIYCYATGIPVIVDPDDPNGIEYAAYAHDAPSLEHALIAHIDIQKALETGVVEARLVYVSLTDALDMEGAVQAVRDGRKVEPFGRLTSTPDVSVEVAFDPHEQLLAWIQRRVDVLGRTKEGRSALSANWPKGTPAPMNGLLSHGVDAVVALLDRVEAHVGIPFGETDPRVPATGHKEAML